VLLEIVSLRWKTSRPKVNGQTSIVAKASGSALLIASGTMPIVVELAKASRSLPLLETVGSSTTARDTE
jgi:hypothetical protein